MPRTAIISDRLPPAAGPFSPAIRADDTLYLSGQIAQDPSTGKLVAGDVVAQLEQIWRNIAVLLDAAGKSFDDVVKVTIYLTNMSAFTAMNAAYARTFRSPFPARTTVAVSALPLGAAIELDVIAR